MITNDGWETWTTRPFGVPGYVSGGVSFLDSLHGWVGGGLQGTDTAVVATTDGGNTWSHYSFGIPFISARQIDFVDSLNGWLLGGGVFHSPDGGRSWAEQGTFGHFAGSIATIQAIDSIQAWVFGDYFAPFIWKTTDGGQNWVLEYNGPGSYIQDAVMVDTSHGVAVGGNGIALIYAPLILGDLNCDEEVTTSDVILELNKVFLDQNFPSPEEAADVDCDNLLTSTDVVRLLNRAFLGIPFPCAK